MRRTTIRELHLRTGALVNQAAEGHCIDLTWQLIRIENKQRVNDPSLQKAYQYLAAIYGGLKRPALERAFLKTTVGLGADTTFGKWAQERLTANEVPLRMEDVAFLVQKNFNDFAVADAIAVSPLGFSLAQKQAEELALGGWPVVVLNAILQKSQTTSQKETNRAETLLGQWAKRDARLVEEAMRISLADFETLFKRHCAEFNQEDYERSNAGFKKLAYRTLFAEEEATALQGALAYLSYNSFLACGGYSMQQKKNDALDWLEIAVATGFLKVEKSQEMLGWGQLDPIRNESRFQQILGGEQLEPTSSTGWVGLRLKDLSADDRTRRKLPDGVGILIVEVSKGGPAANVGLKVNDVIVRIEDELVGDAARLTQWIAERTPGSKFSVTYFRDGEFWKEILVVAKAP